MRMILVIVLLLSINIDAGAQSSVDEVTRKRVQSIVSALDYVAIDYPVAVHEGEVINSAEYAEQLDFLETVTELLLALPESQTNGFLGQAGALTKRLIERAPASEISELSRALKAGLLRAYELETAPGNLPDLAAATHLYAQSCAVCHGIEGRGDGPAAGAMEPPPTDFHDGERARQRSIYSLYSAISLGIDGTSMTAFPALGEDERWALAFYVAGLRDTPQLIAQGERYWAEGTLGDGSLSFAELSSQTPAELAEPNSREEAVLAFLRHNPGVLQPARSNPIGYAQAGLRASLNAYQQGDAELAMQLALDAYLEGYELTEGSLRTLDRGLATDIERGMQVLRGQIRDRVPYTVQKALTAEIQGQLERAAKLLSGQGSSVVAVFVSALLILLREGLEAILVIATIGLYLRRTGHARSMGYLHLGWMGALLVGAVTWVAIKTVIVISGAQREILEGAGALLAAFVLLYVGIWMHRQGSAVRWQSFLDKRLGSSLSRGALWGVAGLSFIAVYREILETILFYETLWLQSAQLVPLLSGAGMALVLLLGIGWLVFSVGSRLPLRRFFQVNGVLMFMLAVIFVGKGVSALQEAGRVDITFVSLPRVDWLGIYPTVQSAGAQFAVFAIGMAWILLGLRKPNSARE